MKSEEIFKKSVWQAIFQMAVPSLVSILVMMLYNMADMYFVGWLGDVSQVAAVSLVSPVFTILMAISTMLGNGGCTMIAQALGKGEEDKVRGYSSLCIWSSLASGLIFMALCLPLQNPLLRFLGANEQMWSYAKIYLVVLAIGAPFILLNHNLASIIRGEGAIRQSMIANFVATIANIILDPIFIIVLRLGVGGAAIATVLGNVMGILYICWFWKHHETHLSCRIQDAREHWRSLFHIIALGMPNAITSTLGGFASTFSNQLLVRYGTEAVAAMGAAGKSTMIIGMVQMGICMGVQPLMAYCYGSGDILRLKEIVRKLALLTVSLGAVLALGSFLLREVLVGLFLKDAAAIKLGVHLVSFLVISSPFIGFFYLGVNLMQAAGKALTATFASALRQGILLIPMLYLLEALFHLEGLPLAHIVSDVISIAVSILLSVCYLRKLEKNLVPSPAIFYNK